MTKRYVIQLPTSGYFQMDYIEIRWTIMYSSLRYILKWK